MTIWADFFDEYDRKRPDERGLKALFLSFVEEHAGELLREEEANHSTKTKVSVTAASFRQGGSLASEIKQAAIFAERVLVSPATPLICQVSRDSRFWALTQDSFLWTRAPRPIKGRLVSIGFGSELSKAAEWVVEARPFFLSGRLNYLPFIAGRSISGGESQATPGDVLYPLAWDLGVFGVPLTETDVSDPVEWQRGAISRDWMVAEKLGARPVLPSVLAAPMVVSRSVDDRFGAGIALARLTIPNMRRLSFAQLDVLLTEERRSFSRFVRAIDEAISGLAMDPTASAEEFAARARKIQVELIDDEVERIGRRLQSLQRYETMRVGVSALSGSAVVAVLVFAPEFGDAAKGALGGITTLKLYESVVGVLEKRNAVIRDDAQSFLARLTFR